MKIAENKLHKEHFFFLDFLRAGAAWLVVYSHIIAEYPKQNGLSLPFVEKVDAYINVPLGIIQNFGWLGVCIFFLISGFVITHVSMRESPAEFFIKRIFRIYPMLIIAVLTAVAAGGGNKYYAWSCFEQYSINKLLANSSNDPGWRGLDLGY